ncbi:MAG: CBS domain-containing protein [Candidatus Thermoplasmatota archaeon]|nr:CBS domain-containing protein [Candidatus Thermoplasmatota archaeon]MBU1941522.1 CBS domain-containing protein [Candidatus Thermoplasmatota archaeon]
MPKRLIPDFYSLTVQQVMDRRVWDLPLIEETDDIQTVLNILGARNHIWVVKNKESKELVGVITEHDVLSILAPKTLPSYMFGMPDVKSIQHGTANNAADIMCYRLISCAQNEKINDVLQKMTKYRLRRLPVLDDNIIVGEITLNQLIRKFYDATQYHDITFDEEG